MDAYGMGDAGGGSRLASVIKRMGTAIVSRQPRESILPSADDMSEATRLFEAFEGRGYVFEITPHSWRVKNGDSMSATSDSCLEEGSRPLMIMEALGAAARAEWARRNGCLPDGTLEFPCRAMDMATGLQGEVEDVSGPYAVMLTDPLTLDMPAWAWRAVPGAEEGDRIRLYTLLRSLACGPALDGLEPVPTWGAVASAARKGLVKGTHLEDAVAPAFGGP